MLDADCSQLAGIAVYGNVGTQINTSYFGTALLELLFEGTADKMDGALRDLLILSSYSP